MRMHLAYELSDMEKAIAGDVSCMHNKLYEM